MCSVLCYPTKQIYDRGIFAEHSHEILQHIWKKLRMNFRRIFRNNIPGILNTGIFPDFIMNILRMLQISCIFLGGSRNTVAVFYSERQFLIFTLFL